MDPREEPNDAYDDEVQEQSRVLPIVVLALLACLIGLTVYLFLDLRSAKAEIATLAETSQQYEERFAQLEGSVNRTTRTVDDDIKDLKGVVEKQLTATVARVEQKVLGRTNTLAKQIEEQRAASERQSSEVAGRLDELREVASSTGSRVGNLSGTVDEVKEQVAKNRRELDEAIRDLTSVKGDLGVQSGLIATNASEVQTLRDLGERNYYEFDLTRTKQPQRVGSIQIKLRKADQKRNKYTIELWADDKKIQKKDKTLLEPVQFYVIGSRIPYEIVVNKLTKNRIIGYLSTPKTQPRQRAAAASVGSD